MKKKYIRVNEVCARYGDCSIRTVDRGVQEGVIAPPEYLNGRRIWSEELLDEYDAKRPQGSPPTPLSSGGRGRPRKIVAVSPDEAGANQQPKSIGNKVDLGQIAEQRKAENARYRERAVPR